MKLHIITPLYRFNLLEEVYNSILMNDDIIWHISKSNKREELDYDFLKKDKRIIALKQLSYKILKKKLKIDLVCSFI